MTDEQRILPGWTADDLSLARRLIDVGIALSAESNLERLLQLIVKEAQALTGCHASSLYLREGEELRFFVVSQHEDLRHQHLPLSDRSIAGYVVLTGQNLNIPDVYGLSPELPYAFNREFDQKTGYRTGSMLTVPMRNTAGTIVGALQLINRLKSSHPSDPDPGQISAWTIPFSPLDVSMAEALASQAAVAYHNVMLRQELKSAHFETIFRLSVAAEYRDQDTSFHLKRMSNYSRIIAKHLNLSFEQQELIFYASPMHDVGKIGIPDAILLKPGRLTPEEMLVMQQHPEIGSRILGESESELMKLSSLIALTHHEKFDGSGYPRHLSGYQIPLEGRVVALADVFDALASKRPYKAAWTLEDVFAMVDQNTGSHFDPDIVAAFYRGKAEILEIYHQYQEPDHAG